MTFDFGYILSLVFPQIGRRSKDIWGFFQILNCAKTDALMKYQRFKFVLNYSKGFPKYILWEIEL